MLVSWANDSPTARGVGRMKISVASLAMSLFFLLSTTAGHAGEDLPCYPAEAPIGARTQIVWCKSKTGSKDFFRVAFKPSPDQCKVAACEHQAVPSKQRPKESAYKKVPEGDCASALNRPGCFMQ